MIFPLPLFIGIAMELGSYYTRHLLLPLAGTQLQLVYDSASVSYSCSGYNNLFGTSHLKIYDPHSQLCANVIRSVLCSPFSDNSVEDMIVTISCD